MRSLSDIKSALIAKLETQESGAWSKLQNSLVGRELIAFGAEVILATDNVASAFVQAFDYKFADERSLISLAHVHDIPVAFTRPAYIRIRISNASQYKFRPFDLVFTVGGVKFTNISFYNGNDDIVLYQGIVKSMKTAKLSDFYYEREVDWDITSIPISHTEVLTGHNLGAAFPESVYVFVKDENLSKGIMSEYTPLSAGPSVVCYKLYTLMDKSIAVLDGDGVWGSTPLSGAYYQIIWLELTNNEFSTTGSLISNTYGSLEYKVMSASQGEEDSLEFAREYFRRFYLDLNAIISKDQVRDYVNGYPYVQDCVVSAYNNVVSIYVKPTDPEDKGEYGDIEAMLDLKGCLLTSHEVSKGTAVEFQLSIESSASTAIKGQIESFISETYGYSSLNFSDVVNTSEVAASILSKFGVVCNVAFACNSVSIASGEKLQFIPTAGTLSILNAENKVIGYDLNGQLFSEAVVDVGYLESVSDDDQWLGNYLISRKVGVSKILGFDRGYIKQYPVSALTSLFSDVKGTDIQAKTHNGHVYVWINYATSAGLFVFDIEQINPQGLISNIIPITGLTQRTVCVLDSPAEHNVRVPIYYEGNLYVLVNRSSEVQLQNYTGNSASSYYTMNVPITSTTEVIGVVQSENNLYVLLGGAGSENSCIVISHFDSSACSWAIREISNTDVTGTLVSFHCKANGECALMYKLSESSYEVGVCSELIVNDGKVRVMNYSKVTSVSKSMENPRIYYGNSSLWVTDLTSSLEIVYSETEVYPQTSESGYTVYELGVNSTVGTVNYKDGTVVYDSSMQGTSFSYKSTVVKLDTKSYLKLNDTQQVLWS